MLNREDMLELTRRMSVSRTSITRIAGCYMDAEGEIDGTFNTNFLNLSPGEKQKNLAAHNASPQDITLGVRPSHMVLAKQPGNTLSATIDVSELMGSEVHFHANANGKDVVVIVPTMNADGERIDSFHAGDKLNLTFSGNVCHLFGKDGKNLEF